MRNFRGGLHEKAHVNAGTGKCRNPECGAFIEDVGKRRFVANTQGNMTVLKYCANACYRRHQEITREGAAERVRQFMEKKK